MTTRERCTIECANGIKLDGFVFKPEKKNDTIGVVLVHPYSVLGGCQALMRGIARNLSDHGFPALIFDMRGVGKSTGRPSLTGFSEVNDVVSACKWLSTTLSLPRILLVGSSAGNSTPLLLFTYSII